MMNMPLRTDRSTTQGLTQTKSTSRTEAVDTQSQKSSCLESVSTFLGNLGACLCSCFRGDTGVEDEARQPLLQNTLREAVPYGGLTINQAPNQIEMASLQNTTSVNAPKQSFNLDIPLSIGQALRDKVTEFRQLLIESQETPVEHKTRADNVLKDSDGKDILRSTPLSTAEKKEVLAALKHSGWNWFAMIKDQDSDKVLLRHARLLQKEMTEAFRGALNTDDQTALKGFSAVGSTDVTSDLDYTVVDGNQARQVTMMNDAFRAVFQKEPGIMFDTNFYTAHAILKPGFTITTPLYEKQWMDANEVAARTKVALHFTNLQPETRPDTFEGSHFETRYVKPMIDTQIKIALNKANLTPDSSEGMALAERIATTETQSYTEAYLAVATRNDEIQTKIAEVRTKAQGELDKLKKSPSSPERDLTISLLESKLSNTNEGGAAIEMEAMNLLYADKTAVLEAATTTFIRNEQHLFEQITACATEHGLSEAAIKSWLDTPTGEIDLPEAVQTKLQTLKETVEKQGLDAIKLQMNALQYANEPYFAQTTIVGVVQGMQAINGKTPEEVAQIKKEYPIMERIEMGTHAMEENFGDILKDFHHHHQEPEVFLTRGAKYLERMLIFANMAAEKSDAPEEFKSHLANIKDLSGKLLTLRKDATLSVEDKATEALKQTNAKFGTEAGAHELAEKIFTVAMDLEMTALAHAKADSYIHV